MGKSDPYAYKRKRGQHTAVHPKTYLRRRNGRLYLTEDEFVSLLQEMGYKRKKTGSFRLLLPKYLKKRIKKGLVLA